MSTFLGNIKGEKGDSGYYYGTTEPSSHDVLWINPNGSATTYPTTSEVETMIAEAIGGAIDGEY